MGTTKKPTAPQAAGQDGQQRQQQHVPEKAVSDEEVKRESAKAANSALKLKKEAFRLRQAAQGAGDPEERQKLMEQAINKQIEAESFGKLAKYMQSGTFQGMAVGTGLGVVPGVTLGMLTGTLVGGLVSTITGALGAGLGAITGALHGPFWNMGELAGKGIRKVTGDGPSWDATESQKRTLEKMIGQVNEEEMPGDEELESFTNEWGGYGHVEKSWTDHAKSAWNYKSGEKKPGEPEQTAKVKQAASKPISTNQLKSKDQPAASPRQQPHRQARDAAASPSQQRSTARSETKPNPTEVQKRESSSQKAEQQPGAQERKKPRKLETKSKTSAKQAPESKQKLVDPTEVKPAQPTEKKKPRKIQVRGR